MTSPLQHQPRQSLDRSSAVASQKAGRACRAAGQQAQIEIPGAVATTSAPARSASPACACLVERCGGAGLLHGVCVRRPEGRGAWLEVEAAPERPARPRPSRLLDSRRAAAPSQTARRPAASCVAPGSLTSSGRWGWKRPCPTSPGHGAGPVRPRHRHHPNMVLAALVQPANNMPDKSDSPCKGSNHRFQRGHVRPQQAPDGAPRRHRDLRRASRPAQPVTWTSRSGILQIRLAAGADEWTSVPSTASSAHSPSPRPDQTPEQSRSQSSQPAPAQSQLCNQAAAAQDPRLAQHLSMHDGHNGSPETLCVPPDLQPGGEPQHSYLKTPQPGQEAQPRLSTGPQITTQPAGSLDSNEPRTAWQHSMPTITTAISKGSTTVTAAHRQANQQQQARAGSSELTRSVLPHSQEATWDEGPGPEGDPKAAAAGVRGRPGPSTVAKFTGQVLHNKEGAVLFPEADQDRLPHKQGDTLWPRLSPPWWHPV